MSTKSSSPTMNPEFDFPPINKDQLTPPQVIAERLKELIGTPFPLVGKPKTDGSRIRKLVARTLEQYELPEAAKDYTIVPP